MKLRRRDPLLRSQICPRRILEFGPWGHEATLTDSWRNGGPSFANAAMFPTCSHCGSLHPDVFMDRVREGWIVGGTDKSYKWYLDRPYSAEEVEHIKAGHPAVQAIRESHGNAAAEEYWQSNLADGAYAGTAVAKFYTAHLSRAQCEEFLAMWEARALRHTMYRQPWFPAMAQDAPDWLVQGAGYRGDS